MGVLNKSCLNCTTEIKYGRTDKKFCNDFCRNEYNWKNGSSEKRKKHYRDNKEVYKQKAKEYNLRFKELKMCQWASFRAKRNSIPFEINPSDVFIPEYCPLLGIRLEKNNRGMKDNSPTLDRIDPDQGYIKGNVWVISWKANKAKSNIKKESLIQFCKTILERIS